MWWSLNGRLEQLVAAEAARLLPDALQAAYLTPEAPEERILPATVIPSSARDQLHLAPVHDTLLGSGDATGSNNWAVSARRSASGHAMLASDPHQPFWVPASWHEYALHGPEDHVAGAGHPGVPGIWFGSNGRIAWGLTNNAASTRDLYLEHPHPTDETLYKDGEGKPHGGNAADAGVRRAHAAGDTWRPFTTRTVTIPVRGESRPRTHVIRETIRGPIVNDFLPSVDEHGDPPLSLRWVGQEHLEDLRALIDLNRAHDWPGFRAALSRWAVPAINFGYADATGFVGYQCAGRIPVRGQVKRGYRSAADPQDAWRGYVPFDALPRIENPPTGYVATANNRAAPDDFPYPLHGAWAAGHRAVRLRQSLAGESQSTRDDMIALQNDVKSCRAERLVPPLLAHLAASHDRDVSFLRDTLAAWDYRYTTESAAPLLFESFMRAWQARVASEHFPQRLAPLVTAHGSAAAQLIERGPAALAWFTAGETAFTSALHECALHAVSILRTSVPGERTHWSWGGAHIAHWLHPLTGVLSPADTAHLHVGPSPVDGGADTVRNTGSGPHFEANSGAEYRLVVDFAAPDRIWAVQATGNSGVPGSPHYADQFPVWLAGDYHVVHLDRPALEADLENQLTITPAVT